MLYSKIIQGQKRVYGGQLSGEHVIDFELIGANDVLLYFSKPGVCLFGPTAADVTGAPTENCFVINDLGNYRFTVNRDSRFLLVRPIPSVTWSVFMSLV